MRKTISFTREIHNLCRLCVFLLSFCLISPTVFSQYEKLPYFEGFEDTITYSDWTLNAGPNGQRAENKWYISNADAFMGENALYISSDGGKNLVYENKSIYNVAYKEISLPKGTYDLSFTWKCNGELGVDGLSVCWVSPNFNVNASISEPTFMKNTKIDGLEMLSGSDVWTTSVATFTQSSTSTYKLVFVWVNNEKNANPVSIIIDNIQISLHDGCASKPENVNVSALSKDVTITWTGEALGYELMYRKTGDAESQVVKGINQTSYVLRDMEEGVYDIFVRSCCPNDTSIWVMKNNVLVYNPAAHCIDFINWNNPGTECETGVHEGGGRFDGDKFIANIKKETVKIGAVDFGYASVASRHTLHYMPGETDPRTGNLLPTVPAGEVVSARLGNWNFGGEFESVTYTHQIDSGSNMILLLKYAIVIEDPGHGSGKDNSKITDQPVFMLELLDEYDNPLDASGCGDANFVANTVELIENPDADGTWHIVPASVPILWKEWTTVGINVGQYAKNGPLKFKIRLTTYDCAAGGHFGYAYYTLSCSSAELEGQSCGEQTAASIKAPDGFKYRWYRVRDGKTVCTTQNLTGVEKSDTALYHCKVMFAQDSTCYFELDASLLPRLPKAQFTPRWTPSFCEQNNFKFINTSHVTTARGATGEKCETHRWYLENGANWDLIHEGDSLEYRFPNEGGMFNIMLEAGMSNDECVDDTIITINVPRLGAVVDTICDTICEGKSHKENGKRYMQEGVYRVFRGTSYGGCDSTVYLNLTVIPKQRDTISAYICQGEEYVLNGQVFTRTGKYRTTYKADTAKACECDTIETLLLSVAEIDIDNKIILCSGDSLIIDCKVGDSEFTSYQLLFDSDAQTVGLKNTNKLAFPNDGRIVLGPNDLTDNTSPINPICPGYYKMRVLFYYETELGEEKSCERIVDLDVLYAAATMEQKFDDMITLLDSTQNGGYDFSYYRWYCNGELIREGADSSFVYFGDMELDENAVYTVGLTREGETEEVLSCGLKLNSRTPVETIDEGIVDVVSTILKSGDNAIVMIKDGYDDCIVRWWSVVGMKLGEEKISDFGELQTTPQCQGVYILEFEINNRRMLRKILIE